MTTRRQARSRARVLAGRSIVGLTLLAATLGCANLQEMLGGGEPTEAIAAADGLAAGGDLPGAYEAYEALAASNPESVRVATGLAYMQMLAGELDAADATLAAVEGVASPEELQQLHLRRALVALRLQNLDRIREHGLASDLPEGRLLAAEVLLVDLEREEGTAILRELSGEPGAVGQTASMYVEMLSGEASLADLAEVTALWSLGVRESACEASEDLVKQLPPDYEQKDMMLLLWAGRAVTSGLPNVARSLLDELTFPPPGQEWRLQATQAMIAIASGDTEAGMERFAALQGAAETGELPADGIADAMATACMLAPTPEARAQLVEGMESAAASRCLMEAGDLDGARSIAPPGILKTYLENN
jgi:hypothetical protein